MKILLRGRGLLVLLFVLVWTAAAFAAPAITVTPTVGPPTTKITVKGTGFTASKAVDVYFDTVSLCLAGTNSAGAFSCTIKVPDMAQPTGHWVSAVSRVTGVFAQKKFTVRSNWPMRGNTPGRSGYNRYENALSVYNAAGLSRLWKKVLGDKVLGSSPAVVNNVVYVGSIDGKIYAFNATTGAAIAGFPVTTGGAIYSSPAVSSGVVYVGSNDGKLYAFNAKTGAAMGGFPKATGGGITSSPVVSNGKVYVGSFDKKLYAFNATTGAAIAGFPVTTGGAIGSSPAVANGIVYVSSDKLYALNASTGATVAGFPATAGAQTLSSLAVANGIVYVGSWDGFLYAFNATTGAPVLGFPADTGGVIASSPVVAYDIVYVGSDTGFYAFNAYNGTPRAGFPVEVGPVPSSPAVANGVVYVGSNSYGNLYAIEAYFGGILWSYQTGDAINSSLSVVNGTVYVGSQDKGLYAFSLFGETYSASKEAAQPEPAELVPDYTLTLQQAQEDEL